jgi:general stress protein YciG
MSDDQNLNRDDQPQNTTQGDEQPASEQQPASAEPQQTTEAARPAKKRRGFAVMDPKRVSEIASKGGKAAHAAGTAHEFSREEAREAGRKGGYATHARRKAGKGSGEGAPSGQ